MSAAGGLRTASRLAAFALVLAGTFATAYAVGERLPGHDHEADAADDHGDDHSDDMTGDDMTGDDMTGDDMTGDDGHSAPVPEVRSSTDLGYTLVTEVVPDEAGTVSLHLERPAGTPVTAFTETHGALLHLIVVRPDLSEFHHVHPEIGGDGSWTVQLPGDGPWHVVAEAQPTGASEAIVVATDVGDIGEAGGFVATDLPAPADRVEIDGLTVERDGASGLEFTVTPSDGLEPYLGLPAHLVVLRDGDLAFVHLHPSGGEPGRFVFDGELPAGSTYRVFLQFGHHGEVVTVPFTVVQG